MNSLGIQFKNDVFLFGNPFIIGEINHLFDTIWHCFLVRVRATKNCAISISLILVGFLGIELQLGDWIELDDTTVDPHIKCFGTSWSGKQFIINELNLAADGSYLKVKAIELF